MHREWSTPSRKLLGLLAIGVLLLASCADDDRRGIRLTPTATAEPGVRALVDNCPGPTTVALAVRADVLWQIDAPPAPETDPLTIDDTEDDTTVPDTSAPGIAEFVIGQTPEGWTTTIALDEPLQAGTRYTVLTAPDGQTVDFSTPDLAGGLLWDGVGNLRFNPGLISAECSEPADIAGFTQNLLVLGLLGATSVALVLVAIIALLFVLTRRFSRVRTLQRKAQEQNQPQRPRARSKS